MICSLFSKFRIIESQSKRCLRTKEISKDPIHCWVFSKGESFGSIKSSNFWISLIEEILINFCVLIEYQEIIDWSDR